MKYLRKIRSSIDRFLGHTHDHYTWVLPDDIPGIPGLFLKWTLGRIKIDEHQMEVLRSLPRDAAVVYVTKHKSNLERLFAFFRYKKAGLAYPQIGLFYRMWLLQPVSRLCKIWTAHADHFFRHFSFPDPLERDYVRKEMDLGRHVFLSLVESDGFYLGRRKSKTDPVQYLIETQQRCERTIYLVPQLFFYKSRSITPPDPVPNPLVGYESKPGRLRRLWRVITAPGKVFAEISEPVNLRMFIDAHAGRDSGEMAVVLRRQLLEQISLHRQSITGPVLKSNEEIKQHILTSSRLQEYMNTYARRRDLPMYKVVDEALKYIDEIVARPRALFISIAMRLVDRLLKSMFEEISLNSEGLQAVKKASRKGPLILIPCHKSHVDYLVLSYMVIRNNMPCPHTFAGSNLAFWPMGTIMRWGGAFFVRRTFKGAVFYSKVFAEYIHLLLSQGYNIQVFIEGTRSRSGKLLLPKVGMLTILLNAAKNGAVRNMIFVPVFVGYDRVPEDASYLHEIEGGKKEPENFRQMLRARRLLKKKFGKIYINFGDPIALSELEQDNGGKPVREFSSKEINAVSRRLGNRVLSDINRHAVVTPQGLVSAALLNTARETVSHDRVMFNINTYMTYLQTIKAPLSETLMVTPESALEHILQYYIQNKFIQRTVSGDMPSGAEQYKINEARRTAMDYYKNSCIGHFVPAAFSSMAILANDSFQFSSDNLLADYVFLDDLFSNEFQYKAESSTEYRLRKTIKAFIDDAILVPHPTLPDTYDLTSIGYRKLMSFAGFIKPLLESYYVVLVHTMRLKPQKTKSRDPL